MGDVRPTERRARTAAVVVALGLVFSSVPAGAVGDGPATSSTVQRPATPARGAQADGDDRGELQAEYDEVLGIERRLLDDLARIEADRERVGAELAKLEADVEARQRELATARQQLVEAEQAEKASVAARRAADLEVARTRRRLQQQAVAAYVNGGQDTDLMGAILRADSISDADTAITYSRVVLGDTDALLEDYEAAQVRRRRAQKAAESARAAATSRRDEVQDLATFVIAARDDRKRLAGELDLSMWNEALKLQEIQGRKVLVQSRITAMNHASDGVAMLLAAVQEGQPAWTPGAFVITTPTPGYPMGSAFGPRHHPILAITRLHAGVDIGAPSGTPIHAPADGMVVFAGERGGYGNTVVIDHGHSLGTLYGHQSRLNVATGDLVVRGQVIGYVGSTGLSTGPHLHFETRIKGLPVDPASVVDWDAEVDYG